MNDTDQNFVSTFIDSRYQCTVLYSKIYQKSKVYPVWFNLIIVDRRKLRLLKIGSPLLSGREEQNGTSGTLQSGFTAWTVEMQRLQRELIAHACGPGRPYGSCTVLRRPPLGPARCCYAVTLTTTVL